MLFSQPKNSRWTTLSSFLKKIVISDVKPDLLLANCNGGLTFVYNIATKENATIIDVNEQWLYSMYIIPGKCCQFYILQSHFLSLFCCRSPLPQRF